MTRRRTVVKEQTSLSPDKKIVGLQIFLAGPVTRDLDRGLDINLAAEQALFFSKENATKRYIDSGRHHENNWKTKEGGVGRSSEVLPGGGGGGGGGWGGKAKVSLPAPPPIVTR